MATLDDKLLGEKKHYYCSSSSEDENGDDVDSGQTDSCMKQQHESAAASASCPADDWQGYSSNTGPKGVIRDFELWKELEAEKRAVEAKRTIELAQKLSLSCQTSQQADDEKQKEEELEREMEALLDSDSDPVLQEFMRKRMQEMLKATCGSKHMFGRLIRCNDGSEFLKEIEDDVRVICHIYSLKVKACHQLNECLNELATRHPTIKFVCIEVGLCGMSHRFEEKACPTILVYKKGSLLASFISVTDQFGQQFDADDVESFLTEHSFLVDPRCQPEIVATETGSKFYSSTPQNDDSDDED